MMVDSVKYKLNLNSVSYIDASWDWPQAVCVKVCQLLAVGQWFPRRLRFPPSVKRIFYLYDLHLDMTLDVAAPLSPNKLNYCLVAY